MAGKFFYAVVEQANRERLTSSEYFTVDGTLIEAWASLKSFKSKEGVDKDPPDDRGGNPPVDFRGEKRSNDTHASTTDPEARLAKEEQGEGGKTLLLRPRIDGKSQRATDRLPCRLGRWPS